MNFRIVIALVVVGFVVFCGWLVVESGFDFRFRGNDKGTAGQSCVLLQKTMADEEGETAGVPAGKNERLEAADFTTFGADNAPARTVILGAADPETEDPDIGFKFQLELSSKGAAIRKATFSNGNDNGFDDRDYKDPQPLVILSSVSRPDGGEILSMANKGFQNEALVQQGRELPLQDLHWKSYVEKAAGSSQTARFEATIKVQDTNEPVIKLIKTYKVTPGRYLLECKLTVENLSDIGQKVRFNLTGPIGLGREGVRGDMRKAVAGFRDSQGQITSERRDVKKLRKAKKIDGRRLVKGGDRFLWVAAVNKYFAAILVPVPEEGKNYCDWVTDKTGRFYNPDGDERNDSGDETIGVDLKIASIALAPTGQADSAKTYNFQLYVGPKDKSLFDNNEMYKELGFVETIDFLGCCCPQRIISPLAFGILRIMKWMYGFVANYGVVIIILVLLFRTAMHPITKKSQVSMSKFGKLAPKVEEIKKKYANNKAEMNKQMMALYREQGASPIMGFLPMMVQMPIWIALWSAVYASIDLRGAPFLPFWITDLSVPDALVRFATITVPLLGWKIRSLNLLPLLMGVAMYLQQKLMPRQAAAATNPQMAQQQKMMMIMFPLFLPLVLYNAPSGVNLYIMTSTFAGVFEQHVIRKHIREKDEAESKGLVAATSKTGGKIKKKKPKPFYKM
ncbi:MAG: YidC/Oxa1 family insertase periplasmic-domain containing protein [Planctomycetota bacterium]|jgi:YidC/Oxa1 family membrane protein insertase